MKKILMGLLAFSTILNAAATNLGDNAANGNDVFMQNQTGRIAMQGNISAVPSDIKYVVYASDDNGITKEDVWNIGNLYVSTTEGLFNNVDPTTLPKLYVKRVQKGDGDIEALGSETVAFEIKFDPDYTGIPARMPAISSPGTTNAVSQFAFIPKTTLEGIVGAGGFAVDNLGNISKEGRVYSSKEFAAFKVPEKGVLEIVSVLGPKPTMTPLEIQTLESYFSAAQPIASVNVDVKIVR